MKNAIIGGTMIIVILLLSLIHMSINAEDIRRNELEKAMNNATRTTMEVAKVKQPYNIDSNEELIEEFTKNLLTNIDTKTEVEIQIMGVDIDSGLLDVVAISHFQYPTGADGQVSTRKTIIFDEDKIMSKGFEFDLASNTINSYEGEDDVLIIPNYINNTRITTINTKAMTDLSANYLRISDNITLIKEGAIKNSKNLATVEFSGVSFPTLEAGVFDGCNKLKNIIIPTGTKVKAKSELAKSGLDVSKINITEKTNRDAINNDIIEIVIQEYNDGNPINNSESISQTYISNNYHTKIYSGDGYEKYDGNTRVVYQVKNVFKKSLDKSDSVDETSIVKAEILHSDSQPKEVFVYYNGKSNDTTLDIDFHKLIDKKTGEIVELSNSSGNDMKIKILDIWKSR